MPTETEIKQSSEAGREYSAGEKLHVLIADSDIILCELMKYNLEAEGYVVDLCHSVEKGLRAEPRIYSLIIVDVGMIGHDSVHVATKMRQNGNTADTPLIFTSASVTEEGIIGTIEAGVDDFLKKPFSMREMLARINAVMRRYKKVPAQSAPKRVCHDDLCVNLQLREATMADEPIDLTMQECQLLGFLMLNRNKLYSAGEIVSALWPGSKLAVEPMANVKSMVESIRRRIGTYAFNLVADECFSYTYVE